MHGRGARGAEERRKSPLRAWQPRQGCDPAKRASKASCLLHALAQTLLSAPRWTASPGERTGRRPWWGGRGRVRARVTGVARGGCRGTNWSVVRARRFFASPPRARLPLSLSLLLLSHPRAAPPPHPSPHTPHLTTMAFALSSKAGLAASSTRSRVVSGRDDGGGRDCALSKRGWDFLGASPAALCGRPPPGGLGWATPPRTPLSPGRARCRTVRAARSVGHPGARQAWHQGRAGRAVYPPPPPHQPTRPSPASQGASTPTSGLRDPAFLFSHCRRDPRRGLPPHYGGPSRPARRLPLTPTLLSSPLPPPPPRSPPPARPSPCVPPTARSGCPARTRPPT